MGKLTCEEAQHLGRPVHMEEIIQAIQAGNPNKAPGWMGSMLTSLSYVGRLWGMMLLLQSQIVSRKENCSSRSKTLILPLCQKQK